MANPSQTVEAIRGLLKNEPVGGAPEFPRLAAEYGALCREANARLRRCADFLDQGLVGEAVHFADAPPPLLDFAGALQFKESPDWEERCAALGLGRSAPLATQTLTKLKEAVDRHQSLRELLARHRFLSLARAPLGERMLVVRQLRAEDPQSPLWNKQLIDLEQARLGAVRAEAAAAIAAADLPTIDKLLAELRSGLWESHPPPDLVEALQRASAALNESQGVQELGALAPLVRQACAAMVYEQAVRVFEQWAKIVRERKLTVPPELRAVIRPLAQWIDEQDEHAHRQKQFRTACAEVVQAAQMQGTLEELKALYRRVTSFETEIPPQVTEAYRQGTEHARREMLAEKKRQYALAAALVAAIVTALGALAFVIINSARH